MTETMIRTQVYLPRRIHEKLRQRAEQHGLTLAVQIRAALEDYLDRVEAQEDDGILHADDPIFQMAGIFSGPGDLSVNHDHYLYGAPRRDLSVEDATAAIVTERPPAKYERRSPKPRTASKKKAK